MDAAVPLVRSVLGAAAAWAVLAVLYRDSRRGAIAASVLVIAFFGYGHVAGALATPAVPTGVQLAVWAVAIVGTFAYAARARTTLPRATAGLNGLAVALVVLAAVSIVPYEVGRASRGPASAAEAVAVPSAAGSKRDIYFIVFDRYGSADAIERRFGLTGNDMYSWLEEHGFQVPANPHGNYRATDFSLAATLNMQYLDNLTQDIGRVSGDRTPAHQMLANHAVGRFLQANGYRYYQLGSWFEPTRSIPIADENLTLGIASEFESVLADTTIVPAVQGMLGVAAAEPTFRDRVRDGTLYQLRQLRRVATAPGPKFVFAHILLPHDPYVFAADGSVVTADEERATDEKELYAAHLAYANARIREMVGYLLAGPEDKRPIVIIEGDEGPLACQNVDCVGDTPDYFRIRLGNLIAMYLPGVDEVLPETFSSVNTFRTVLRAYFGADLPPLPDRAFTWPDNDHIYDFRDITDLIGPDPD